MKRHFLGLALALPILFMVSCDKTETPTADDVREAVSAGTWRISLFSKSGTVYYDFEDYAFTFSSNGTVKAESGNDEVNGTWTLWEIDGGTQLDLDMGDTEPFALLDNDWDVTHASSTRVKTENDVAGPVSYLTFEKN